jgi:hypothetical protein
LYLVIHLNKYYQLTWKDAHICFDCFQDITRYNRASVFIVGDNDQAIYQDLGVSIKDKDIIESDLYLVIHLNKYYQLTWKDAHICFDCFQEILRQPYCHSLDDKHKELLVIQEYNTFKKNNRLIDFDVPCSSQL